MKKDITSLHHDIENKIVTIRGMQVMIDRDLAELYGVEPKRLNEQVKRNIERFPDTFRFQLSEPEKDNLVANCDRFEMLKYSTSLPYAFSEQGVSMLSAVLRSKTAIEVSIKIIDSFVNMRRFISNNALLFDKMERIEHKLFDHDTQIDKIFQVIEERDIHPKQGIFFDGQIFDAYMFVNNVLNQAKSSVVLIDNYVDESVLLQLSSQTSSQVEMTILTKEVNKKLALAVKKHNAQYKTIHIKEFSRSHDRFLIIDEKDIYHIGASLKDLGKKWFAFSLMDRDSITLIKEIEKVIK